MDSAKAGGSVKAASTAASTVTPAPRKRSRFHAGVLINWRLVVTTVLLLIVIIPSVYAWHGYQVQQHADDFLQQASRAEEEGDFSKAAEWLFRYLQFRPDDAECRARTALVFDQAATTPNQKVRSAELLAVALGLLPDRDDLRQRYAEVLLELGRSEDALAEAQALLVKDAENVRAERVAGMATTRLWRNQKRPLDTAVATVMSAYKRNTADVELAAALAELLREREEPDEANLIMNGLIHFHQERGEPEALAKALLARYAYRQRYGIEGDDEDLAEARRIQPKNIDALMLAAVASRQSQDLEKAARLFREGIEIAPTDRRCYLGLATTLRASEKLLESISVLHEGIAAAGKDDLELHLLLLRTQLDEATRQRTVAAIQPIQDQIDATQKLYAAWSTKLSPTARSRVAEVLNIGQAELYLLTGEPGKAVPLLQRSASAAQRTDDVQQDKREIGRRLILLGQAYAALGQWDLSASAFESTTNVLGPESLGAATAHATALWTAGRLEQASLVLQRALNSAKEPPESVLLLLARIELTQLVRRASTEDWKTFDATITALEATQDVTIRGEVLLLKVQAARRRGQTEDAKRLLEEAISVAPAVALPAAVLLYQSWDNAADADAALLAYRMRPDSDRLRADLLQAELLIRRQQTDAARDFLTEQVKQRPEHRDQLEQRLIRLEMTEGELGTVAAMLKSRLQREPSNISSLQQLGELALQRGDLAELRRCETELKQIEGSAGGLWRFFAVMRIAEELGEASDWAQHPDAVVARRLCRDLDSLRPHWPATHLALGRVAFRDGQLERAADEFAQAIRLGSDNLLVYDWLIRLLYSQNRSSEAFEYINRLREAALYQNSNLASIAPDIVARSGKLDVAIRLARLGINQQNSDSHDAAYAHTWLGVLLTLEANEKSGEEQKTLLAEAESLFQEAVRLVADQPRVDQSKIWGQVFWFYARTGKKDLAHDALQHVADAAGESRLHRSLALAQGYTALREVDEAEKHFDEAAQIAPKDLSVLEARARFLHQVRPLKAEVAWREILKLEPNHATAAQTLATLLVALGGEDRFTEAVAILSHLSGKADRRLEAILRIRRGGNDNLRVARRLLEDLISTAAAETSADRAILAGVLERQGNIAASKKQWQDLLAKDKPPLDFVAQYIAFLLRNKLTDECAPWIEVLKQESPDDISTVQLECRWMKAASQTEMAIAQVVEDFKDKQLASLADAEDELEKARVLSTVAQLYASLDLTGSARQAFERLAEVWPRDASIRAFAAWLVQQDQHDEAIQIALKSAQTGDPGISATSTLANLLIQCSVVGKEYPVAEQTVQRSIEETGEPVRLLFDLATLKQMQGKREEAERLYRSILEKSPRFVPAMNNLALLLSENPDQQRQSQELMKSALAMAGHVSELQDSYAWILVNAGEWDQAAQLLRQLIDQNGGNSRFYFHLAGAEHRSGRTKEARAALQEALRRDLQSELLMPSERDLLEQMRQEFSLEGPPAPIQPQRS